MHPVRSTTKEREATLFTVVVGAGELDFRSRGEGPTKPYLFVPSKGLPSLYCMGDEAPAHVFTLFSFHSCTNSTLPPASL
jgi:hypothetical protein